MKKITTYLFLLFAGFELAAQTMEQKMDALVSAYAAQGQFNGTVLVGHQNKIVFQKGFGFRNTVRKEMNDANSIFQVGSLTKQFTAAIIMQLYQEKKLDLQDKLSKYFPGFTNGDQITIEHLLTHTSGLFNYTNDSTVMHGDLAAHYSEEKFLDKFRTYPADFAPGTEWNYSNTGYVILGYIISKIEKKPYETVMRERILRPLGMNHSGFDFTHLSHPQKTTGYFYVHEGGREAPVVDSTISHAAGALYATVGDLYKWERAVSSNKILNEGSWKKVFTPYKNKYGYGWNLDTVFSRPITHHSGGIPGYLSYILRFPGEDLSVIIVDNSSSNEIFKIAKGLSAIVLNQPYDLPTIKKGITLAPDVLQQYIGKYQLAPEFIITITVENNGLRAQATNQPVLELLAEKEDHFFIKLVDAKIQFTKDEQGKVDGLILFQNGQMPRAKKIQ